MLFHSSCHLSVRFRNLFWIFKIFFFVVNCVGYLTFECLGYLRLSKSSLSQNVFQGVGDKFILIDLRVIIHVNWGSSQPPFFKKNNCCFPSQGNFGHQNNKFNKKPLDIDHRNHPSWDVLCNVPIRSEPFQIMTEIAILCYAFVQFSATSLVCNYAKIKLF